MNKEKICLKVLVDKNLAENVEKDLLDHNIVIEEAMSNFLTQVIDNNELTMLLGVLKNRERRPSK